MHVKELWKIGRFVTVIRVIFVDLGPLHYFSSHNILKVDASNVAFEEAGA